MIGMILGSRLLGPAAAIVAVLFMAMAVGQCTRAVKAENRATRAEAAALLADANLSVCKGNLGAALASEQRQKDAVAAVTAESKAMVGRSEKAARAARAAAETYRKRAERVLAERPRSDDLCAEAERSLREP